MIKFYCPNCRQKLGVPDSYAGRRIRCNGCSNTSIVPKLTSGTACAPTHPDLPKSASAANSNSSDNNLLTAEDIFPRKKSESRVCSSAAHAKPGNGKDIADNTNSPADDELRLMPQEPVPPPDPEAEKIRLASIKRSQEQAQEAVEIIDFPDDSIVENPPGYWPFAFPLRGPGLGLIGIFTVGLALIIAARLLRLYGFRRRRRYFLLTTLFGGYLCWYLDLCIQTTACGKIRSPEVLHQSEGDYMDLFLQIARMVLTIAVSLIPPLSYYIWLALTYPIRSTSLSGDMAFWSLLAGGLFFLPMMILSVILHDSATALNPILIIDSIRRTAAQYLVLVLCFFPLLAVAAIIPIFLYRFGIWFIAPGSAFSIYFLMVAAAILGRFFYRNEKKLNWDV
jgi:hypothetical protein